MPLSPEEKSFLINLIEQGEALPRCFLDALFPAPSGGEFHWQGKYGEKGTTSVTPSDGTALTETIFAKTSFIDPFITAPWRNLLFFGDNLTALHCLSAKETRNDLDKAGGIRLIYIDPPFAVGTDFHMAAPKVAGQENVLPREKILAYSDRWESMEAYYSMLYPRLVLMHRLLAEDGCLCLHCDWRTAPALRLILDEIFGSRRFLNEIVWHYTGGGRSARYFSRKHDNLLLYAKGDSWTFNVDAVRQPYKKTSGFARSGIVSRAGKQYLPNPRGTPADDVWDIPIVNPMAAERLGYATQKPLRLLERLITALTKPGDIVADFFCGSGTTAAAAQTLGRRWIACDQSSLAIETTTKRLEAILKSNSAPESFGEFLVHVFDGKHAS